MPSSSITLALAAPGDWVVSTSALTASMLSSAARIALEATVPLQLADPLLCARDDGVQMETRRRLAVLQGQDVHLGGPSSAMR